MFLLKLRQKISQLPFCDDILLIFNKIQVTFLYLKSHLAKTQIKESRLYKNNKQR